MEVIFLGTGGSYPTPERGASCILLRREGTVFMFDCGEGSQVQLIKSKVSHGKITKIFITHLHGDHMFGLPGLLCTMSLQSRTKPLNIYGPIGLRKFIRTALELGRATLSFQYTIHELLPDQSQIPDKWKNWYVDGDSQNLPSHPSEVLADPIASDTHTGMWRLFDDHEEGITVIAGALRHSVPSFGFVIQEHDQAGRLMVEKLQDKGVPPGPLYAKLKAGESIVSPGGETIEPSDFLGPRKLGRKITILGDTSDTSSMEAAIRGSDLLIHEATFADEFKEKALEKGHSTPAMAATSSRRCQVKELVLTHIRIRHDEPPPPSSDHTSDPPQQSSSTSDSVSSSRNDRVLLEQAKRIFENTSLANDFRELNVERR